MTGFPWDFTETPASWRREAPAFGQHTEEILLELGYAIDDIARLKEKGVIQ
jgi:crotonobetainyl-CoA:carnitine CoA-transferase CaiB-like acyl-CoA transferase